MTRNLVSEIVEKKGVKEKGLRVTLSRYKKKYDLKSIEQAACLYIKKHMLDINVSSIIDDITRTEINKFNIASPSPPIKQLKSSSKTRPFIAPKLSWVAKNYYSQAERLSDFYCYLFIFENALRLKINSIMSIMDPNWWTKILQIDLPSVYKYFEDEKDRQAKLQMIGSTCELTPLDYLTIGHLENIITKYQNQFIPHIFPTLHFFTGHMVIVKRVRNALAHMTPSCTLKDIRNAKNEIDILLQHLSKI